MRTLILVSNFHDVMKTSVIIQNGGTFRNLNVDDDEGIRDLVSTRLWQNHMLPVAHNGQPECT
jgi:hypothetical protein